MSGKHTFRATSCAAKQAPKKPDTRNRAHSSIDQGDTLAELRAAWGKAESRVPKSMRYKTAVLGSGKPLDWARVIAAVKRFGV